jgi:hypothetical protein
MLHWPLRDGARDAQVGFLRQLLGNVLAAHDAEQAPDQRAALLQEHRVQYVAHTRLQTGRESRSTAAAQPYRR